MRTTLGNPTTIDEEGMLNDIKVQEIDNICPTCEEKCQDVNQFFHPPSVEEVDRSKKAYCICRLCPMVTKIVNEVTMLRRHMDFKHQVRFQSTLFL